MTPGLAGKMTHMQKVSDRYLLKSCFVKLCLDRLARDKDLSCMYLAHHELESVTIIVVIRLASMHSNPYRVFVLVMVTSAVSPRAYWDVAVQSVPSAIKQFFSMLVHTDRQLPLLGIHHSWSGTSFLAPEL